MCYYKKLLRMIFNRGKIKNKFGYIKRSIINKL